MAERSWVTRAVIAAAVVLAVVVGSVILWTEGGGDGADETAEVEASDEAPTASPTAVDAGPSSDEESSASPTPAATTDDETPTEATALDGTPLEETPTYTAPEDPVEQGPGGSVLAATDLCAGWTEFTDTFLSMMGGDIGGEPDDPEAVHAYFQAAMLDLAALSPTDEIRDAHLVLATSTLEEFTGQTDDISPRLEAAFTVLDEELTQLCPGPGGG